MSDPFLTAAAAILEKIGVLATFTPASGDPVTGIYVDYTHEAVVQGSDAGSLQIEPTITYLKSDLGRRAVYGESFTITDEDSPVNGSTFTVCETESDDAYTATVTVK